MRNHKKKFLVLLLIFQIQLSCVTTRESQTCQIELSYPPPSTTDGEDALSDIAAKVGKDHATIAEIIVKLLKDKKHPLNLTEALLFAPSRTSSLSIINGVEESHLLGKQSLAEFLADHPRHSILFQPIPPAVNNEADGDLRFQEFATDPSRLSRIPALALKYPIAKTQFKDLTVYQKELEKSVEPAVEAELKSLVCDLSKRIGEEPLLRVRVKSTAGIVEKLHRRKYTVGHISDAVGARIVVKSVRHLQLLYQRLFSAYKTGEGGRILSVDNKYITYNADDPTYRVVSFTIIAPGEFKDYAFELQITTERASIAADLGHNTLYKKVVRISPEEAAYIRRFKEKAAALEQIQ